MQVILCEDYNEIAEKSARIIASQVILKPKSVLGFATGSTPIGTYKKLIEMYNNNELDFSECIGFNLDEYYPISHENPQSYHYFMKTNLFDYINIKKSHIPNGEAEDSSAECEEYDKTIESFGGIDLQILGMGRNGHIGFNEPEENLTANTHLTSLAENTIQANSRFFESVDEVPTHALTMGIATILKSKKILLLVSGKNKHEAVKQLMDNNITTSCPATLLKTHPDTVLIVDREAFYG